MQSEVERLSAWMVAHDHNVTTLAAAVGMSYDGVYQILHVRERVSPGFKLRFITAFGAESGSEVFSPPVVPVPVNA